MNTYRAPLPNPELEAVREYCVDVLTEVRYKYNQSSTTEHSDKWKKDIHYWQGLIDLLDDNHGEIYDLIELYDRVN